MELKAVLEKPYTENDRIEFIIENNHRNNYEIRETETDLQAWGLDEHDIFINTKADKIALNDELRDDALISGVTYKDVLFDSDTDQKVNLLAIITTMPDDDNIVWFGMKNEPLMCSKADLIAIGELITELHAYCWMRNAEIKQEIAEAETMEQLNEVDISYDR